MNPYHDMVAQWARLANDAKSFPQGGFAPCSRPAISPDAPRALIFSPHPDDEVIIGGLALRFLRESAWNVLNIAVTQGSRKERQAARLAELKGCCEFIGFGLEQTGASGLEKVNPTTRNQEPQYWDQLVAVIAGILLRHRPRVIFFPHELDWNSTHIGTHYLVSDALRTLPADFRCDVIETEFWGAMASPNLMVEIAPRELGDMMAALTFHTGEVSRNPYHLSLPAWMMDNVRRGAELMGGQGSAAPPFSFATLYRLRRWAHGRLERPSETGRALSASDDPASIFKT